MRNLIYRCKLAFWAFVHAPHLEIRSSLGDKDVVNIVSGHVYACVRELNWAESYAKLIADMTGMAIYDRRTP